MAGTPITELQGPPAGPGLVTILRQRRDSVLADLETYAERFATHDDLGLTDQAELEQRLDDFRHYDQLLERVGSSVTAQRSAGDVYTLHHATRSFFADLVHRHLHRDPAAVERLDRHMAVVARSRSDRIEVSRDVGTAAFGAVVVPQYLTELSAGMARTSRPLTTAAGILPLGPEGMTVKVPRVTGGPAVAAQATDNAAVQETDLDEEGDLTISVFPVAGIQQVSRAVFDRASSSVDLFLYPDMVRAYDAELDRLLINGTGTGEPTGILNTSGITSVTYTDASPTAAELVAKITYAAKAAAGARKLPMEAVVMHSRRWYWLTKDIAAVPAVTTRQPVPGSPYVGDIAGMGVILDDNIPTTASTDQDRIIVCRPDDMAVLADPEPVFTADSQDAANTLTVGLAARGYAAITAARYASGIGVVSGTGLADPGTW